MAQVLVITKPDRTRHIAPLSNKSYWLGWNNRVTEDKRVKIETMEEDAAHKLAFIDPNHTTSAGALAQNKALQDENEALRKQLEALQAKAGGADAGTKTGAKPERTAKDVIELIEACTEPGQIEALIAGDDRVSVKAAAEKKIKSFTE